MTKPASRLAPSPTGALHLGNARSFLINWALARYYGWMLHMRIEDLDGPRVKPHASEQALNDLRWLGIDWDGEPLVQSADLDPYRDAMRSLAEERLVYSCDLTRTQIEAASSAPHIGQHELRYPPDLRPGHDLNRFSFVDEHTNYRFIVPNELIEIDDRIAGRVLHHAFNEVGDFVVWTRRAIPAYQLAVVVDDARQGVTDVVRGDDLLPSAARQMLIYRALGFTPPNWWHLPLVVGTDGKRLAKRHGDTRLETYRQAGVTPQRILGLLAEWCGIHEEVDGREEMTADEFRERLDVNTLRMCRSPVVFTEEHHQWLLRGC